LKLHEIISTIDSLDDLWVSKIIALFDLRFGYEGSPQSEASLLICAAMSDASEAFPRLVSNPHVVQVFTDYEASLCQSKAAIQTMFLEAGFDLDIDIKVVNPLGVGLTPS
jgi:hypothetical protein